MSKQVVQRFSKKYFWKCIGWIISEMTYGKKWYRILGETREHENGKVKCKIQRYICGKIYLQKVINHLYHFNLCLFCQQNMLSYTNLSIYWLFLWAPNFIYLIHFWHLLQNFQGVHELLFIFLLLSIRQGYW